MFDRRTPVAPTPHMLKERATGCLQPVPHFGVGRADVPRPATSATTGCTAATDLEILSFDAALADQWRAFVDECDEATLFHGLGWKRAVERSFGHRSHYLLARRAGCVAGVLPLFEIASVLTGRFLISVPYATYGGALIRGDDPDGADTTRALLDAARRIARQVGARSIELRSPTARFDALPVARSHATFRKVLPASERALEVFLPRKARAAGRRAAEQHRLEASFGDEHLKTVWQLYVRSMRRLASVNYPYRFFQALIDATPGAHVVGLVSCEGRPVAGLFSFIHRRTFMPYFVGLDERSAIYGLSHYLYYASMQWAVRHGCEVYDFGRSRLDNPGPFDFKRHCGFEPTTLEYQTCVMPGRSAPDLAPTSPRWSAARRVWRALPLTVTRPLGGWLARSLPG